MANVGEPAAPLQDLLIEGDYSPVPQDQGFRGPVAQRVAGITYRQLDYWARTGLVVPEIREAGGSGTQRLYSFRDVLLLRVVKRLLGIGISLQQVRVAINHLRARGVEDLTEITLLSDGASVYECTNGNEIYDLSKGGQGMFLIALGGVWRDLEGDLLQLPTAASAEPAVDELAARRSKKIG